MMSVSRTKIILRRFIFFVNHSHVEKKPVTCKKKSYLSFQLFNCKLHGLSVLNLHVRVKLISKSHQDLFLVSYGNKILSYESNLRQEEFWFGLVLIFVILFVLFDVSGKGQIVAYKYVPSGQEVSEKESGQVAHLQSFQKNKSNQGG